MKMSNESTPGVGELGDTRTTPGLELVTVTVTPPCCDAPRLILPPSMSPAPVVDSPDNEIPGCTTETVRTPVEDIWIKPGEVTLSVLTPLVSGWKATPPAFTVVGE